MDVVEEVVCLTGASGDLASWLVKLLLYRGYTVKATVRDPSLRPKENATFACRGWGSKERLQLFKADLLEEGSFDVVVRECAGVFNAASPMILTRTDPKARDVIMKTLWFGEPGNFNLPCIKREGRVIGFKFDPMEATIRDTVESLKERGFLRIPT